MYSSYAQQKAVFLDFDGTLVQFAERPDAVAVPAELRTLLAQLLVSHQGAVALVSGRTISSIDELLSMPELPVAGSHGAEWRLSNGERGEMPLASHDFYLATQLLTDYAAAHDLLMEDKVHSIALHFRRQPQLRAQIDRFIEEKIQPLKGLRTIYGNCVREIQPLGTDKGRAVARFMSQAPFTNRVPFYFGDDTTDEDAFGWVNVHGGQTFKVGAGATCAQHRLENVDAVRAFLRRMLQEENL